VQEEFRQAEEGLAQTSMDKVLRKGGEGESLTERTLVFLKPEAILRGLMGEIIGRIEKRGLIIAAMKLLQPTRKQAEKVYEVHRGKNFYEPLVEHVISGPILAMVVEGPNAVSIVRNMIGKTSPLEAQPGTIRGDFALDVQKNIVHASDSLENARKEIEILFNPDEILNYRKPTEAQSLL
jgi:nucleoside-diphosphate kinase